MSAAKCFVAGCKTPAWQGLAYCYAHCSQAEIANVVVALEAQVAALAAERDRYREALAAAVAGWEACNESDLGIAMERARELLKEEAK